ncbi:glycoside hydrolase family 43 protein [Pelagibacterium xiamenense]|uniref:glycoside hydrolase family 43 protein n=1 Tax=Pelagibacterium xiamenense TaxID=2901140 RepID=UPI00272C58D4|nr:glycoside hydrolase family 43 protein [Pelagibacterium xiamenense]
MVRNPILPGFNPDPSICRAGEDYYIATSTFEWYPGVQIHHSKDLANWTLAARPLDRASLLDMRGAPDSGGVWAPCLSLADGKFWLVYTDMKRHHGSFKDGHNYLTTAPAIEGPWSEPLRLNSSGFDPSLFHDDDGRKWLVQMLWDHRARPNLFAGIALQEYDPERRTLTGPRKVIFYGTDLALTEGPHLYKRNGWYYLLTAEGGTGFDHACTLARSRQLEGPYEVHPQRHILTAKDNPRHPIQRAGHGDIVDTPDGRTYLVHLMGRPITQKRRCVLGRETGIQEAEWRDDDWLWVKDGPLPSLEVDVPGTPVASAGIRQFRFDGPALDPDFQWLRTPASERLFSLTERPGTLCLYGRESIGDWYEQALIARRQTAFSYRAETEVDFAPVDEREMAGLTAYYSRHALYYLAVTAHSDGKRELLLMTAEANTRGGTLAYPAPPVPLPQTGKVRLAVSVDHGTLQFSYALEGDTEFTPVGPALDASVLSDEASVSVGGGCFTGAFVGMCAADLNGYGKPAFYSYFTYDER